MWWILILKLWMLVMKRMSKHLKCLVALRHKLLCFGRTMYMLKLPHFANFDSSRTRACTLPSLQGEPNKKLKRKKRWLSIGSFAIAYAINNFTHVVKEIKILKMEMTKFITCQMLQSEINGKQMMIQGQL